MPLSIARLATLLFIAALVGGCATTGGPDPWEGMNRKTYEFNDALDKAVLKPVAETYVKVVPGFAREGVGNFFNNLQEPATSINNLLQGKPREAVGDAGRFLVNSVLGIFGLWDVATPMGIERHHEDFGQTLGRWGVQPGPYFVIPLLGPSTARDAPARVVDPQYAWNRYLDSDGLMWSLFVMDVVRTRADLLKAGRILDEAAFDPYAFTRDAWLQRRRSQIYDGHPPKLKDEEE